VLRQDKAAALEKKKLFAHFKAMPEQFSDELSFRQLTAGATRVGAMNWTRGLFRFWVLGSVLWVLFVGSTIDWTDWTTTLGCSSAASGPWCDYRSLRRLDVLITALGYPLAAFASGAALLWAIRGFNNTASRRPAGVGGDRLAGSDGDGDADRAGQPR
jgi:hypothetical protein